MLDTNPTRTESMTAQDDRRLRAVKLVHTAAWAFFATCVIGIPLEVWNGRLALAAVLIGLVGVETGVLLANAWRCPLTDVAARYNKEIFGTLYAAGIVYTIVRWVGARA